MPFCAKVCRSKRTRALQNPELGSACKKQKSWGPPAKSKRVGVRLQKAKEFGSACKKQQVRICLAGSMLLVVSGE